jgi:HD-like signal output (HDOD) protein
MDLVSLRIRLERSENLPVMPQAVSSVLRIADDPEASPKMLENILDKDPGITAKILRVANSAYYGFPQVKTIGQAISFLGMASIRSVVLSVALQNMLKGRSQAPAFDKLEYWRHCLGTATICRILGRLRMQSKAEELYCAGMMHDIGMLVMDRFMGHEFNKVIKEAKAEGAPIHLVMKDRLGFDHLAVGEILAERWGLSDLIRRAIAYHLDPTQDGEYYEATCIVCAANTLSHEAGLPNHGDGMGVGISPEVAKAIGLPIAQFPILQQVAVNEVIKAQAAFHI